MFERYLSLVLASLAGAVVAATASAAAAAPASPEAMASLLRDAIAARDYEAIEAVINWDGAGVIKRRVVAFSVRRGLGRSVKSIAIAPISNDSVAAGAAQAHLRLNMPISHRIDVVYDEPPRDGSGPAPKSVYLIGEASDGWRIALVVRRPGAHDDDD